MERRVGRRFYQRDVQRVAQALLGKVLVHGKRRGIIVETEAYLGPEDRASHARFGKTARNEVMFGAGGIAYVYLCYGVHHLFNIVTGIDGQAGAVLIRALQPKSGYDLAYDTARGPGKLTRAMDLSCSDNGRNLMTDPTLYVAAAQAIRRPAIETGPRIGVDYADDWARAPLRFWVAAHPCVSRQPKSKRAS